MILGSPLGAFGVQKPTLEEEISGQILDSCPGGFQGTIFDSFLINFGGILRSFLESCLYDFMLE